MGKKSKMSRHYQRWILHRWANKWVAGLGALQSMQVMLFIFPESATMQKVPLELSRSGALTRVNPLHIFLLFTVMHLTGFFNALNFTMSSQTVEQVTCKCRLFYKSDVLNWGCL